MGIFSPGKFEGGHGGTLEARVLNPGSILWHTEGPTIKVPRIAYDLLIELSRRRTRV